MINIDELIKESLKSGNKTELKTYRNLKAEFQKVRTAKNAPEWNDALEMQIISKYSRILEDAILQFSQAHRDDLVSEYTSELEVVKKLLPEPVNEAQIMYELFQWSKNDFENFSSTLEYDAIDLGSLADEFIEQLKALNLKDSILAAMTIKTYYENTELDKDKWQKDLRTWCNEKHKIIQLFAEIIEHLNW